VFTRFDDDFDKEDIIEKVAAWKVNE